jgi:hypothetical protein
MSTGRVSWAVAESGDGKFGSMHLEMNVESDSAEIRRLWKVPVP